MASWFKILSLYYIMVNRLNLFLIDKIIKEGYKDKRNNKIEDAFNKIKV